MQSENRLESAPQTASEGFGRPASGRGSFRPSHSRSAFPPAHGRRSLRPAGPLAVLACAVVTAVIPAAGSAQPDDETEGLDIEFLTFEYDGATGRTVLTELRITQGELSIEADRGSSIEAQESDADVAVTEYQLEGGVAIRGEDVLITGDSAEFVARNEVLQRFELRGDPARFEDLSPGGGGQAFGEAERLVYDAAEGIVSLNGEARIVLGPYAYVGCDLIYDIAAEASRSGSSECEQRLQRIRISPSEDAAGQEAP